MEVSILCLVKSIPYKAYHCLWSRLCRLFNLIHRLKAQGPRLKVCFKNWHTTCGARRTISKTPKAAEILKKAYALILKCFGHRKSLALCALRLGPLFILPCALSLVPWASVAEAATVSIAWDRSAGTDIAGYKIHYGTTSGNYSFNVDVGNYASCAISGLAEGQTYYFAATSYTVDNLESALSKELVYAIPASGSKTPVSGGNEAKIWIEAEDAVLYPPMEENWNTDASAGGYVWVPPGGGNLYSISGGNGSAEYTFEVQQAGTYLLWGRVISNSTVEDSFFVAVDGETPIEWHTQLGGTETWIWDQLRDGPVSDNQVVYLDLDAGQHTLTVKQREDGTKLDKILLSNDLEYVPQGKGETSDETGKVPDNPPGSTDPSGFKLWLEAESASLSYPFESASDSKASGGQYVWVPNGQGNSWDPNRDSRYIGYNFKAPAAGDYVIWGRVRSSSGSDNSFFIAIDDGDYALWDTKRSKSWAWDQINSRASDPVVYHLQAGDHTLIIKQREDGTRLDKILITGDLAYTPE
jgi:hypothetical protein